MRLQNRSLLHFQVSAPTVAALRNRTIMTVATRITTPFGRETTAQDVLQCADLTGKRAVVTVSASEVGRETAVFWPRPGPR